MHQSSWWHCGDPGCEDTGLSIHQRILYTMRVEMNGLHSALALAIPHAIQHIQLLRRPLTGLALLHRV